MSKKYKIQGASKKIEMPNKYELYEGAVQDSEFDVELYNQIYSEINNTKALTLREDFCGTHWLCYEWIKQSSDHIAHGIDKSQEPIDFGFEKRTKNLTEEQKPRLKTLFKDVREVTDFKYNLIVAANFSYFIFKERKILLEYFKAVLASLDNNGLFIMDHFGGSGNEAGNIEEKDCVLNNRLKYKYFWHQKNYKPIKNEAEFAIHFKVPKNEKLRDAFTYDWRMWQIPEVKDVLLDAGFKDVVVYWEDDDGDFKQEIDGEEDAANWIAQIVGIK